MERKTEIKIDGKEERKNTKRWKERSRKKIGMRRMKERNKDEDNNEVEGGRGRREEEKK